MPHKKLSTSKRGSRGGVKFWVTEGGKGGQKKIFSTIKDHTKIFAPFLPHLGTFLVKSFQKCLIFCLRGGGE